MNYGYKNNPKLDIPQSSFFIEHEVDGAVIAQRPSDGYINATEMCNKAGKLFGHYYDLKHTQEFLKELSSVIGIPITGIIQKKQGGVPHEQGTWVHPDVAIHIAQWLSAKFAVQVSMWVREWISGNISGRLPYHLRRYTANMGKIPNGYFSMLNESIYSLFAPLEQLGYTIPDKLMPDISYGRMYSDWLRKQGINPNEFPEYLHEFTDGKRPAVNARLYPNKYLGDFKDYLSNIWIPSQAIKYFDKADKKAIPYILQILRLPAPKPKQPKKKKQE